MSWEVEYLPEANQDLKNLDGSQRLLVLKAIKKVQQNPISIYEGGYGKPLGNKNGSDLSGFLKVKLKSAGLRVVYKVVRQDDKMLIIVIGARADEEVYGIAQKESLIITFNYSESQNKFDSHYNYFINIALHIRSLRSLRAYRLIVNEKIFFSFTINMKPPAKIYIKRNKLH